MAFILTKKPREHRLECETPEGAYFTLTFREMTEEERAKFDLERAKVRNRPGDKPEDAARRFDLLIAQVAAALIVSWDGITDEDGAPVEASGDNRRAFVTDPETRKYWRPYIFRYLWPDVKGAGKGHDAPEAEAAEGENGPDPQFY